MRDASTFMPANGPLGGQAGGGLHILARERLRSVRYSRFVARARLLLPLTAGGIILVLGAWPSLSTGFDRLAAKLPRLDLAQIRDLRMMNPRYTGLDKDQRPFTITATSAREQGANTSDGNALIGLESPKADILSKEGAWIVAAGSTGIYQPQAHLLDLAGEVTLFHDKGYRFQTKSARIDLDTGAAEGRDPISGAGPSGTVEGQGFRILHRGDDVIFTGRSRLVLNAAHPAEK